MRRFPIALCLAALASATPACAEAQLRPGEHRPLGPEQGWLVVAVESELAVSSVRMCRRRGGACESAGPFQDAGDVRVLPLPRGVWCVARVAGGGHATAPARPSLCARVEAGQTTYPGHVRFDWREDASGLGGGSASYEPDPGPVRRALARAFPEVLAAWTEP